MQVGKRKTTSFNSLLRTEMSLEFLRSLILTKEFYCIQIQSFHPPGNDRKSFQSYIVVSYYIYFSSFLYIINTSITEVYEVLALLELKTAESSHES